MSTRLSGTLDNPITNGSDGDNSWIILAEVELHVNGHIMVPELAGWKKSQLKISPEELFDKPFIEEVPHWVCEIISPSSAGNDKIKKRKTYLDIGINYYWIIDPALELLEAYQSEQKQNWSEIGIYGGNSKVFVKPFEDIEIDLGNLWPPRKPQF